MLILLETLSKWLFIASLLGLVAGWWQRDALPEPEFFDSRIVEAPRQTKTRTAEFAVAAGDQRYRIKPLYDYELDGMVVSMSHAHSFTDIYHAEWQDFLNLKDICVIWGDNVRSAVYRDMDFDNTTWTCWASWPNAAVGRRFREDALSNNHLLADRPEVQQAILAARPGDQVRLRGHLAEYRNPANGFVRGTSISRHDRGNGACETVYVERFEIVRAANRGWRRLFAVSTWLAPLSLLAFVALLLVTPVRRGAPG
ncbi:MAG: hypothetical protein QNJ91_01080 [Gammaproteobacteria bacterium]|nr:hypothetical protein [Gammaproteobacteria bacterium]